MDFYICGGVLAQVPRGYQGTTVNVQYGTLIYELSNTLPVEPSEGTMVTQGGDKHQHAIQIRTWKFKRNHKTSYVTGAGERVWGAQPCLP